MMNVVAARKALADLGRICAALTRTLALRERGVSLIEMAVALSLTGIVGAAATAGMAQVSRIPPAVVGSLSSTTTLQLTSGAIANDVHFSQVFAPKLGEKFTTFSSIDFAVPAPKVVEASYTHSSAADTVVRQTVEGGEAVSETTVGRNIPVPPPLARDIDTGVISSKVAQEVSVLQEEKKAETDLLLVLEAPGPSIHPPDQGPPPMDPKAFCLRTSFSVAGKDQLIIGEGLVGGAATIAGSNHSITGSVVANGGLSVFGAGHILPPIGEIGESTCHMKLLPSMFPTVAFTFPSSVDLSLVPSVWEDARRRILKPGVYVVNGDLTLDGSEVRGQVTFIAHSINIRGTSILLTPSLNGVLLLAQGGGAAPETIVISGNNHRMRGLLYAHAGNVRVSGFTINLDGAIIVRQGSLTVTGASVRISMSQSLFRTADKVSLKD